MWLVGLLGPVGAVGALGVGLGGGQPAQPRIAIRSKQMNDN